MNSLSFRAKLLCILFLTILGLSIVTAVSFLGLRHLNMVNEDVQTLSQFSNKVEGKVANVFRVREHMYSLDNENINNFLDEIEGSRGESSQELVPVLSIVGVDVSDASIVAAFEAYEEYLSQVLVTSIMHREFGFSAGSGVRSEVTEQGDNLSQEVSFLLIISDQLESLREAERNLVLTPSASNFTAHDNAYNEFYDVLSDFDMVDRFEDILFSYENVVDEFWSTSLDYYQSIKELGSSLDKAERTLSDLSGSLRESTTAARSDATSSSKVALLVLLSVSALVGIVVVSILSWTMTTMRSSLNKIVQDLRKVQDGDLTARLDVNTKRNDEFDQLSLAVNGMSDGLDMLVKDVVKSADKAMHQLYSLSQEIASLKVSNQHVDEQTGSVVASTEEISATLSDFSQTTDTLSSKAGLTHQSALNGASKLGLALTSINEASRVILETHGNMVELESQSKDIDKVIVMINELASQTNLLALNAAIEAARAGEAGRGFSVVADEVRSLAERTVNATSRITEIVEAIQDSTRTASASIALGKEHIESVERYSADTETAIHGIESDARESAEATDQMASSIKDVAIATRQISQDMDHVSNSIGQDAKSIVAINGNAERVTSLLKELNDKASSFKVSTG